MKKVCRLRLGNTAAPSAQRAPSKRAGRTSTACAFPIDVSASEVVETEGEIRENLFHREGGALLAGWPGLVTRAICLEDACERYV
jgi:hypothetical protein